MINKDLLKQLIIEEKKKHKMNLVEQAPAAPAAPAAAPAAPAAGTPAPAGKPPAAGQPAPAALNMQDADVKAAVTAWAQMLKSTKSPVLVKLKPFFDANKVPS